jgi:oligopeptide transport system substrate-binding protein
MKAHLRLPNAIQFLLWSVIVLTLLSGCGRRISPADKGCSTGVLHIGNQIEPQDLDPHTITGVQESHIVSALLEGLVSPDPVDLHPVPGAAQRWTLSPDGLRYTFYLWPNGKWSNGDSLTAHDFVFSFKRILSPRLGSEYSYMLFCIKNAEAYNAGKLKDFSQVGAQAVDDTTLVITLEKPVPYFLSLIMHSSWYPVHPATILKYGAIDERGTSWTRPGNFVGNGPFVLSKWILNTVIEVQKNPRYWDAKTVRLTCIRFYPIDNALTEERAFRTGQLHVTTNVPASKIAWYRMHHPELLRIDPYLATYFYLINVKRPPFDDVRVRRALSMAIDRESIVKNVLKGGQLPAYFFTPPNTQGYTCSTGVIYNPDSARKLLVQAGYSPAHPFPHVKLLYNTSEMHHTLAQAVQEMWRKNLHVNIELDNEEWKVYLSSKHSGDYDMARMGWTGDYNDPTTFLDMWVTNGGNNSTGWSSPAYDNFIAKAAGESNRDKRYAYFQQAERVLLDQMPIIPMYIYTNLSLVNPSVKGWYSNILGVHPFKYVYLEKQ